MDSSSDESFTWEKASSGSDDDDKELTRMNGDENKIKVKYEKKNIEKEEDNEVIEPKAKKRKHSDKDISFEEVDSPKKKKIKTEPESDSDARKKKKKSAHMPSMNGYVNDSNESDQQDDKFLNMCVKQEQEYLKSPNPVKSKKSKKQQDSAFDIVNSSQEQDCNDPLKKEKKSKKKKKHSSKDISTNSASDNDLHYNENNGDCIDNKIEEMEEPIRKSPKKKKSKESRLSERYNSPSSDIEDKFSAEETKVQKYYDHVNATKTNEYNNEELIENDHSSNVENSLDKSDSETNSHNPSKLQNSKNITSTTRTVTQNASPKKKISLKPILQSTPNNVGSQSKNNPGRLLDRIRFEEDPESDIDTNKDNNDTTPYLKKYLKQNESLQPILKGFQNGSEITNDDEIWILKCPHDIDIQKLNDTDFNLDSKSKMKINGETYCGNLDETESKLTIMTSDKHDFIIKNIVANGTIHFRKRLPKPHVQEDNVIVNNQTDFIPLPETKCRHPLFGSNFKDAIKVRERRARADSAATDLEVSATYEKKKKKKHKKDHSIKPKVEMDYDLSCGTSPKLENDSDVPVKKVKKRKHTSNDDSFKKKSKKIKLELDSADAWESEKAIEENLFNF